MVKLGALCFLGMSLNNLPIFGVHIGRQIGRLFNLRSLVALSFNRLSYKARSSLRPGLGCRLLPGQLTGHLPNSDHSFDLLLSQHSGHGDAMMAIFDKVDISDLGQGHWWYFHTALPGGGGYTYPTQLVMGLQWTKVGIKVLATTPAATASNLAD